MNGIRLAYGAGALLGLTGVIAGALGAHALEQSLDADALDAFETAVRFQMYHALVLLLLGTMQERAVGSRALPGIAWLMIAGTLMFSGSIYLLVLTPLSLGIVTPIGGTVLIAGWVWLLIWGLRRKLGRP